MLEADFERVADRTICITNRMLCGEGFLERISLVLSAKPAGLILREKDLDDNAYEELADRVGALCRAAGTPLTIHGHLEIARNLRCESVHLTLDGLEQATGPQKRCFAEIGASCHSAAEARRAVALGCTRILAGHVYPTACKPGVPGRGLGFLRRLCRETEAPVWAIGGIDAARIAEVCEAGARGGCMMSSLML